MSDFAYRLKTADIGAIVLDSDFTITDVTPSAAAMLGVEAATLAGRPLLDMHHAPEARAKVDLLLAQAASARQPAASMMVPMPGRVLHVRVCPLDGRGGGYVVILHGVDAAPSQQHPEPPRRLLKVPVESGGVTLFIEPETIFYVQAEGHYSRIHAAAGAHFCTLALADLERRLDPAIFFRPHRSFLVNLRHVGAFRRRDTAAELVLDRPAGRVVPVSRGRVQTLRELLAV